MEGQVCYKCLDSEEKIKNVERRLAILIQFPDVSSICDDQLILSNNCVKHLEKNLAVETFQASTQRIEELEQELSCNEDKKKFDLFKKAIKEMHIQMQMDYSVAIQMLEHKLESVSSDLGIESQKVNKKEAELIELQHEIAALKIEQQSWRSLQNREQNLREKCLSLESKCLEYENILQKIRPSQVLEEEVERLRKQLSSTESQRNELYTALEETQKSAEQYGLQEIEARNKVGEAIALVETTLLEKQKIQNQLVLTENECRRLQKELIELIEEAGKKVKKEVDIAKKCFQEQLKSTQSQLALLESERSMKNSQLEKQQQEITRLENELEDLKRKSISPRKLQVVSEELHSCEMKLEQLQIENKSLNEIIMQNQHRFETEMSKCGVERRFLEKQILKLQTNLGETGHNLEKAVEQCYQLSDHLNKLSNELITERASNESDNSELLKQLHITKIQSNSAMNELKKFVNSHNNITSKWKDEFSIMTSKLSDRMKELKLENKKEKKRNRRLLKKLSNTRSRKEVSVHYENETASGENYVVVTPIELESAV